MSQREPDATILFVDDDDGILRAIRRALEGERLRVLTAGGAVEALEVLRETRVDVLVSDVDMPEMTGIELLRRVRRDFPSVLRMLLTGSASLDSAVRAINEGEVLRFFVKPFDLDLFRHSLQALAERIANARGDDAELSRRARSAALEQWLAERFPGLARLERAPSGHVLIDVDELVGELEAAGALTAADLARGNT